MSDTARSLTDHRDHVAAEPRPTRVADRPTATGTDVIRLYKPEWVIAHTERGDILEEVYADVVAYFERHYAGRVREEDVAFHTRHDKGAHPVVVQLKLCLPVLKGEFKNRRLANTWAEENKIDDFWTVERNSAADRDLRAYGTKKLATA